MGQKNTKTIIKNHIVLIQDPPRSEEITLQVPEKRFLFIMSALNTFKADLIAASNLINTPGLPQYIWLHDSGNRIQNAIHSGLFGQDVIVLEKPITRGTQKILLNMSLYELTKCIQGELGQKFKLIAHTPITHGGVHCVFF